MGHNVVRCWFINDKNGFPEYMYDQLHFVCLFCFVLFFCFFANEETLITMHSIQVAGVQSDLTFQILKDSKRKVTRSTSPLEHWPPPLSPWSCPTLQSQECRHSSLTSKIPRFENDKTFSDHVNPLFFKSYLMQECKRERGSAC